MVGGLPGEQLKDALASLALADIVVAATLVYKAGFSGLFKSFVDVMDDLLIGKPVVLAATAGSARHTMVADDRLRPLFTFLRAVTVPTAVFAAPSVWADPALGRRIERAATGDTVLLSAGVEERIVQRSWRGYQHQFGSNFAHA
ncbi:NAD(P)H-dependent oxidoreductase [Streptomyces violaceoruber]|uniref:NAD(P)H-dependent oxidoreductase n=1 Tax=Streptomyces TaxID=1883 RepID=UPI000A622AB6